MSWGGALQGGAAEMFGLPRIPRTGERSQRRASYPRAGANPPKPAEPERPRKRARQRRSPPLPERRKARALTAALGQLDRADAMLRWWSEESEADPVNVAENLHQALARLDRALHRTNALPAGFVLGPVLVAMNPENLHGAPVTSVVATVSSVPLAEELAPFLRRLHEPDTRSALLQRLGDAFRRARTALENVLADLPPVLDIQV